MSNKIAVVAGGTGGVGEGIVKALLKDQYTVCVPTRSEEKAERLKDYVKDINNGELIVHVGSFTDETSSQSVAKFLQQEFQNIDLAVASLGGWHQGYPVYNYPLQEWNRILNDNLTAHFLAIKALVPLLNVKKGCYVHINGFSADEQYPMAGPVSMTAAAQKSLVLTLAKEVAGQSIRVHELILGPMKTRDRLKHSLGKPDWYFPEEIGSYIIELQSDFPNNEVIHYLLSKKTS